MPLYATLLFIMTCYWYLNVWQSHWLTYLHFQNFPEYIYTLVSCMIFNSALSLSKYHQWYELCWIEILIKENCCFYNGEFGSTKMWMQSRQLPDQKIISRLQLNRDHSTRNHTHLQAFAHLSRWDRVTSFFTRRR